MTNLKFILSIILFCLFILKNTSQTQKIDIQTSPNSTVYIDGTLSKKNEGKYLMHRNKDPKQLKVKRPGYLDEYLSLWQKENSNTFYHKVVIENNKPEIKLWNDSLKKIIFNIESYNIKNEAIKIRYFKNIKEYQKHQKTDRYQIGSNNLIINNQELKLNLDFIIKILNEKEYNNVTENKVLMSPFSKLYLDLEINEIQYTRIDYNGFYGPGIISVQSSVTWILSDFYGDTILKQTIDANSGEFCYKQMNNMDQTYKKAHKNSLENSLTNFMNSQETIKVLYSQELDNFSKVLIPTQKKNESTISKAIEASVIIKQKDKQGSGFIISQDGYIITLSHLVSDTSNLKIILNNGEEYIPEIIRISKKSNLALIKIPKKDLSISSLFLSNKNELATEIYVLSSNDENSSSHSVSRGIISGIRKLNNGLNIIQTDASTNLEKQGGIITNIDGEVIGIIFSKLTGIGIEGINFGIPTYEIFDKLNISYN